MSMMIRRNKLMRVARQQAATRPKKVSKKVVIEEAPQVNEINVIEEKEPVIEKEYHYSRSEISLMKTEELQKLANSLEIEGASELSGNKLKPIIMKKLGL